jgi:hypothetical protein
LQFAARIQQSRLGESWCQRVFASTDESILTTIEPARDFTLRKRFRQIWRESA